MHLCLEVVDVLQFICDELDRKSAFHLALASRAFLEPALDRIWHELDSFAPLVSCLPEDLVTAERVELDDDDDDFIVNDDDSDDSIEEDDGLFSGKKGKQRASNKLTNPRVMLLSLKAGALGLNLTGKLYDSFSSTLIYLLSSQWRTMSICEHMSCF